MVALAFMCIMAIIYVQAAPCGVVYFDNSTEIDIQRTLVSCSQLMDDPMLISSYEKSTSNITLQSQVGLNNLVTIDEVSGSVTLDCFFRMWWTDERWDIPNFFESLKPGLALNGIELRDIAHSEDDTRLRIWEPTDITFTNILSRTQNAETFRLYPNGRLYWSRHLLLVLSQSSFEYRKYPEDEQNIVITYESYGMTANFLQMGFADPPVSYNENAEQQIVFLQNPLWRHIQGDYSASVKQTYYGKFNEREFQNVVMKVKISRVSNGILVRLAFPVLLLILIGAITFWSEESTRIGTTMTLILALSALYIVVFSTVPLVGYLTSFDRYFILLFIVLTSCLAVHQVISSMNNKSANYPLRKFGSRFLEYAGRVVVIPLALSLYLVEFGVSQNGKDGPGTIILVSTSLGVYVAGITVREYPSLKATLTGVIEDLGYKLAHPDKVYVSSMEMFVFNAVKYGKLSVSTKYFFMEKRRDDFDVAEAGRCGVKLQNINKMRSPYGHSTNSGANADAGDQPYDSDDEP